MSYRKRALLSAFVCLAPVSGHTNMDVTNVRGDDVLYFERIDDSVSLLMGAVEACQGTDGDLYSCLCDYPAIVEQVDLALQSAIDDHPSWEGKVLEYEGTILQVPSLRQQVDDVLEVCEA